MFDSIPGMVYSIQHYFIQYDTIVLLRDVFHIGIVIGPRSAVFGVL
jgi:hypothetical protein